MNNIPLNTQELILNTQGLIKKFERMNEQNQIIIISVLQSRIDFGTKDAIKIASWIKNPEVKNNFIHSFLLRGDFSINDLKNLIERETDKKILRGILEKIGLDSEKIQVIFSD